MSDTESPERVQFDDPGTHSGYRTPKKKIKRACTFQDIWLKSYSWLKPAKENVKAHCTLCQKDFYVSHGGKNDINRHQGRAEHKKREESARSTTSLKQFLINDQLTSIEEKVIAAEITKTFHNVKHNLSYNSLDCESKLDRVLYADSKVAEKLTLGRTKSSAIAHNVLGPASIEGTVKYLQSGVYFSVSTDASNHGPIKMFPLVVRFYTPKTDVKTCVLDFYDDANETAIGIYNNIVTRLKNYDIDLKYLTSYSADNTNVNFGDKHSVFKLLQNDNNKIIAVGCPAHILHNGVKHAIEKCKFDVENMVLKVYNYFSYHAKRVQALKDFFEFYDSEFAPVLRHVTTRWLSLLPAIERLVKSYEILKIFFISLGEQECPTVVWTYFNDETTEAYLVFFQNALNIIQETVLQLESDRLLCFEAFNLLTDLKEKINQRIKDQFLGFTCNNLIRKMTTETGITIKSNCILFYENFLKYIEARFDFSESNSINMFQPFALKVNFDYKMAVEIIEKRKIITDFDMDALYEEFYKIKDMLKSAVNDKSSKPIDKWHKIFKSENLPNLSKLYAFMSSVPVSNASTERVFSQMGATWTDKRNKLSIEHVKAEIQIKANFQMTCEEFYKFVSKEKNILKAAKSSSKYVLSKK